MPFYAHSLDNRPESDWETMQQHEDRVAERCATFLARIHPSLEPWGQLLGRWHDLGKYSDDFQQYLRESNDAEASSETRHGRVNHSTAGAQHAVASFPKGVADIAAYVIAGHHAGLADRVSMSGQKRSGLNERLKEAIPDWRRNAPNELLDPPVVGVPVDSLCRNNEHRCGFQLSLFCRLLFSALCDADFVATEAFMSPEVARERADATTPDVQRLSQTLFTYLQRFSKANPSDVNLCRAEVLAAARTAAELDPGFFSFTVPTGGGKTLSSLAFALRHAVAHGQDRVIYAIPFTSIIEQDSRSVSGCLCGTWRRHSARTPQQHRSGRRKPRRPSQLTELGLTAGRHD